MDICWMPASDLAATLRRRELSAAEALEAVLARMAAVNPAINAIALPLVERARKLGKPAYVHLKIETGLHRLGVPLGELASFARYVAGLEGVVVEGAYTHFADVEDPGSSFHREQLDRLAEAVAVVRANGLEPPFVHASPTAGALLLGKTRWRSRASGSDSTVSGLRPRPMPLVATSI